jgi:aminoglycoside/choline kinase family phosphotransferase
MESTHSSKNGAMASRQTALHAWLKTTLKEAPLTLQPMRADASFRRYFRVRSKDQTFVLMDAPPPENCVSFVAVANILRRLGLQAPDILAMDISQGFLLLTDFGDFTYLSVLNAANADGLYGRALEALAVLQTARGDEHFKLPFFSSEFMWQEWHNYKEWFLNQWLHLDIQAIEPALTACYVALVASAVNQPQVFMHRDYHSGNLMKLPHDQVGLLDFQDAFIGPITYDLVSLLRDCYIDWPKTKVEQWVERYRLQLQQINALPASVDAATFLRWFDLMGMQRHLKALMTFARKAVRDQQPAYLAFVPRTLQYLLEVSRRYPELTALHLFLDKQVLPAMTRTIP